MRKVLAIIALSAAGMAGWGCGSTGCGHLQSICDKCSNQSDRDSCDQIVSQYKSLGPTGDMECQTVIDSKAYSQCGS